MSVLGRRFHQARKALALLPHAAWRRGLWHGVGASLEHRRLIGALPVATVVDIGANVGQFTLLCRQLHPGARVVSFEPLAGPAKTFGRLFAGDPLVTLHRFAIAPTAETRQMHMSRSADSSSLLPISEAQVQVFPGTEAVGRETVRSAPLDQFLAPADIAAPALLKLDVQGFELEALKGCASLLGCFAHVYVEVSFLPLYEGQALADEVIAWLAERGFVLAGVGSTTFADDGRCVQADLLFSRKSA